AVGGLLNRHGGARAHELGKNARVPGRQVLDHDEGHAAVGGHVGEEGPERLETPGGCAETDHEVMWLWHELSMTGELAGPAAVGRALNLAKPHLPFHGQPVRPVDHAIDLDQPGVPLHAQPLCNHLAGSGHRHTLLAQSKPGAALPREIRQAVVADKAGIDPNETAHDQSSLLIDERYASPVLHALGDKNPLAIAELQALPLRLGCTAANLVQDPSLPVRLSTYVRDQGETICRLVGGPIAVRRRRSTPPRPMALILHLIERPV